MLGRLSTLEGWRKATLAQRSETQFPPLDDRLVFRSFVNLLQTGDWELVSSILGNVDRQKQPELENLVDAWLHRMDSEPIEEAELTRLSDALVAELSSVPDCLYRQRLADALEQALARSSPEGVATFAGRVPGLWAAGDYTEFVGKAPLVAAVRKDGSEGRYSQTITLVEQTGAATGENDDARWGMVLEVLAAATDVDEGVPGLVEFATGQLAEGALPEFWLAVLELAAKIDRKDIVTALEDANTYSRLRDHVADVGDDPLAARLEQALSLRLGWLNELAESEPLVDNSAAEMSPTILEPGGGSAWYRFPDDRTREVVLEPERPALMTLVHGDQQTVLARQRVAGPSTLLSSDHPEARFVRIEAPRPIRLKVVERSALPRTRDATEASAATVLRSGLGYRVGIPKGEASWIQFNGKKGVVYEVSGSHASGGIDPLFELHDAAQQRLRLDDDAGGNLLPRLRWLCQTNGNYYVKVSSRGTQGGLDVMIREVGTETIAPSVGLGDAADEAHAVRADGKVYPYDGADAREGWLVARITEPGFYALHSSHPVEVSTEAESLCKLLSVPAASTGLEARFRSHWYAPSEGRYRIRFRLDREKRGIVKLEPVPENQRPRTLTLAPTLESATAWDLNEGARAELFASISQPSAFLRFEAREGNQYELSVDHAVQADPRLKVRLGKLDAEQRFEEIQAVDAGSRMRWRCPEDGVYYFSLDKQGAEDAQVFVRSEVREGARPTREPIREASGR